MVWIGRDARGLPGHCRFAVEVRAGPDRSGQRRGGGDGERRTRRRVRGRRAGRRNRARPCADPRRLDVKRRGDDPPARVRLLDQFGLTTPTAEELATRWQTPSRGLEATIGVGAGEDMRVDLRADGPHTLIAGTTGAGKSELLRTVVASLAATHPPSRLTFLLIDYKGGAAFEPCRSFPHVLDVVSDLDAELGERALASLDAEMKRRERLLAENPRRQPHRPRAPGARTRRRPTS